MQLTCTQCGAVFDIDEGVIPPPPPGIVVLCDPCSTKMMAAFGMSKEMITKAVEEALERRRKAELAQWN